MKTRNNKKEIALKEFTTAQFEEAISRYAQALGVPHGRLHFAGEHTGRAIRGMEAAMESGERAATEILGLL